MVPRKLHAPKHLDPKNDTLKTNPTFSNIIEDQISAEIIHGKTFLFDSWTDLFVHFAKNYNENLKQFKKFLIR